MTRNELNNKINFIINSIDPSEKDKEFSWKHLINDFILVEYDKSYDKSYKLKFCKKCNNITIHNGKFCCICNKNSISGCLPNFITKIMFLYFYDRNIQDYIPWEDYKKRFIIQSNEYTDINKILSLLPGFKLYPTFRIQDSDFWSDGNKSAFEQSLVGDNIMWFTYIKFYIDRNDVKNEAKDIIIKLLVVGKSGSLLVNNSGSDLFFSTDVNDGPARRFLAESNNKSSWDKTRVAILPCENESEAFEKENYYLQKLNIFSN